MIKYIIVSPTKDVDLKNSKTGIAVLCSNADEDLYWRDTRNADKLVMFDDRRLADAFIVSHHLEGAFSYGIER